MFSTGGGLQVLWIVALQTTYKRPTQHGGQIGVFTICLLSPPPTRISENVDVRRPVCQTKVAFGRSMLFYRFVMDGPTFQCPLPCHRLKRSGIPCSRHGNSLWIYGGLKGGSCHAMQDFVPPVVRRNAQSFNGRRMIQHLPYFFFKRHAAYQIVYPLLERQFIIPKRKVGGVDLCMGSKRCKHAEGEKCFFGHLLFILKKQRSQLVQATSPGKELMGSVL